VSIERVEKRPRMYGGGIKILRGKRQLYDCKALHTRMMALYKFRPNSLLELSLPITIGYTFYYNTLAFLLLTSSMRLSYELSDYKQLMVG
jgi:hypothetical protein